jgi:hypothetical protein
MKLSIWRNKIKNYKKIYKFTESNYGQHCSNVMGVKAKYRSSHKAKIARQNKTNRSEVTV